jgi:hypothetical protein
MENAAKLFQMKGSRCLVDVSEYRPREEEGDDGVGHREREDVGFAAGVETQAMDVLMVKLEILGIRREMPAAPLDHAAVKVNANVLTGPGTLLEELASDAATPTAPVEHEIICLRRDLGEDDTARRVVVVVVLGGTNELPKLDRR